MTGITAPSQFSAPRRAVASLASGAVVGLTGRPTVTNADLLIFIQG